MHIIIATDGIDADHYAQQHDIPSDGFIMVSPHFPRPKNLRGIDQIHATPAAYNHPHFKAITSFLVNVPQLYSTPIPLPIVLVRSDGGFQWRCRLCGEEYSTLRRGHAIMTANLHHQWRHGGERGSLQPLEYQRTTGANHDTQTAL